MSTTRIALFALIAFAGVRVDAQSARTGAIVRIGFGPTRVSGGEHLSRAASALSIDASRDVHDLPAGALRVGLGMIYPNWEQDPSAVCHVGVHHPCIGSFPTITAAHLDLAWQAAAMKTVLEADLQPTVYWVSRGSPPSFAPAATLSLGRTIWRSAGTFVSGSANYLPSVYGDRIGFELITFGLYFR